MPPPCGEPSPARSDFFSRLRTDPLLPHIVPVLRQYELIERIRAYDPDADRPLPQLSIASSRNPHFVTKPEAVAVAAE